jgi:hypothetical protein
MFYVYFTRLLDTENFRKDGLTRRAKRERMGRDKRSWKVREEWRILCYKLTMNDDHTHFM